MRARFSWLCTVLFCPYPFMSIGISILAPHPAGASPCYFSFAAHLFLAELQSLLPSLGLIVLHVRSHNDADVNAHCHLAGARCSFSRYTEYMLGAANKNCNKLCLFPATREQTDSKCVHVSPGCALSFAVHTHVCP